MADIVMHYNSFLLTLCQGGEQLQPEDCQFVCVDEGVRKMRETYIEPMFDTAFIHI
jgi:hypothetical protein